MSQNIACPPGSSFAKHWALSPDVTFLNHGSFGACPLDVLKKQHELRLELEHEPVQFMEHKLIPLLDEARQEIGALVGAPANDIAFIPNATHGVNTVLQSIDIRPGDELLVTDHEYNACRNALNFAAENRGAKVVVCTIPFPIQSSDEVVEAILARVTPKTRFALIDHITSPTALVLPIERLVRELKSRGIETLVDGAHSIGMVPLNLEKLGAAFYVGNCHKWLCTPKGSAILYTRPDQQTMTRPLAISHGANSTRTDRSRYLQEFDWPGTYDPTPFLCIPKAIEFLEGLFDGKMAGLQKRNHSLTLSARDALCQTLGVNPTCPDEMVGFTATLPLPDSPSHAKASGPFDPLQDLLYQRYRIEVPIMVWPHGTDAIRAHLGAGIQCNRPIYILGASA